VNIAHVIQNFYPRSGGPAQALRELCLQLARQGHRVTIFATDTGMRRNSKSANVEGVDIKFFQVKWLKSYGYAPTFKKSFQATVHDFDVVHVHGLWAHLTLVASRICQEAGVPYITRPCGMLDPYCLAHHGLKKRVYSFLFERENLNQARYIHFTSRGEQVQARSFQILAPKAVVPLGVHVPRKEDETVSETLFKYFPQLKGKKTILFLGRINFKKGLELLVEALPELHQQFSDVHLVLAGPDDEKHGNKVRRMIRSKGIGRLVTFTGFVAGAKKSALLQHSTVSCLPSRQENFGIAVVEAMAAGLPVVVSEQVNISPEIEEAGAGLIVSCHVRDLTSALARILSSEELRSAMGLKGRQLAREKYEWDHVGDQMLDLYKRATGTMSRKLETSHA
jgi:glycosyltransferase involved in cell wall biosynthesis